MPSGTYRAVQVSSPGKLGVVERVPSDPPAGSQGPRRGMWGLPL